MSKKDCSLNIKRLKVGYLSKEDAPFCLAQMVSYIPSDEAEADKVGHLLDGRYNTDAADFTQVCNIGKCTVEILRNETVGKLIEGSCRAASFCLKKEFESVRELPKEAGNAVYQDILSSLEFRMGGNSAGNYCPKLDCGLSAGLSVDGHAGTAGICHDADYGQTALPVK